MILAIGLSGSLSAETKLFSVSQATYTATEVQVQCTADLKADDDATLSITIPADQLKPVEASLRSNVPFTTSISDATPPSKIIEVKVSGKEGKKAIITYLRPHRISDAVGVRHDIDRTPGQATRLSSFLTVKDASASNAEWSKAILLVNGSGLLLEFQVTMQSKHSITVPIGNLQGYPIEMSELEDSIVATDGVSAYLVSQLNNPGGQTIPKGAVQVIANERLLYTTEITNPIQPTGSAGKEPALVRFRPVSPDQISVASESDSQRWHEVVSLKEGRLTVRKHQATVVSVENRKSSRIQVYLPRKAKVEDVDSAEIRSFVVDSKPNDSFSNADLADLQPETVKEHVKKLAEFDPPLDSELAKTLTKIHTQLKTIATLDASIKNLSESKVVIESRLAELPKGSPDLMLITRLYQRLGVLEQELKSEKSKRTASVQKLLTLLFPSQEKLVFLGVAGAVDGKVSANTEIPNDGAVNSGQPRSSETDAAKARSGKAATDGSPSSADGSPNAQELSVETDPAKKAPGEEPPGNTNEKTLDNATEKPLADPLPTPTPENESE